MNNLVISMIIEILNPNYRRQKLEKINNDFLNKGIKK